MCSTAGSVVRERYREGIFRFHLDTLPRLKHGLQSRIYRHLLERQRQRSIARHGRRLLLGSPKWRAGSDASGAALTNPPTRQRKMPPMSYIPGSGEIPPPASPLESGLERGERGYKRSRLAALAGSLYRSGQLAVTEIRETYAQTRARDLDGSFDSQCGVDIASAFPDVAITVHGDEQMVLFPCYAKRHARRKWGPGWDPQYEAAQSGLQEQEYWQMQRERERDEKAVVDVDVRGWIYTSNSGPMTRRNRFLIGLARQLSGIPAPKSVQASDDFEQGEIAQEAAKIERKGQEERHIASRGAYSEAQVPSVPGFRDSTGNITPKSYKRHSAGSLTPDSAPGTPILPPRPGTELSEAELAIANANLMARIAPFMTNPLVGHSVTIFFYNETKSQSKTIFTNDAGHFNVRAALDFVPTHFRVLANERLSDSREVQITDPFGVSLISDIDDTIKASNITGGAREMFRSTFVRELGDLAVEGVREWYGDMHALGVSMHYCSASPWQLFPMLASFFKMSGLPPGSLHLKQYSGMLQGIFEPVAERKKDTLVRLLRDFPQRKFLLVGDSGEADLEVYTELAATHPGRILAIFIRDVTTPEGTPYFEPSFDLARQGVLNMALNDSKSNAGRAAAAAAGAGAGASGLAPKMRQNSAPGVVSESKRFSGPTMGTLIDFSTEPEEASVNSAAALEQLKASRPGTSVSTADLLARKPPPPPRPTKPAALSSASSSSGPAVPRLSRVHTSPNPVTAYPTQHTIRVVPPEDSSSSLASERAGPPPPPPPRRRGTPSSSARNLGTGAAALAQSRSHSSANSDIEPLDPLPPSLGPPPPPSGIPYQHHPAHLSRSGTSSPSASPTLAAANTNKKLELWRRRLLRAQEQLEAAGTALYTWRRGQDVEVEARAIVRRALAEMRRR
ncbi:Uncharacterized protein ESCO_000109 [Escovopsis weberi]|uniref:Phosphatidate phosphatase APP1 catalytic domain-containing protein n=1 Tax=Escovopsis weberi TaxID=150374 RepID=A0A0M9VTU3_ESCWE|nr:Uncharacterized protein ESCO_000109 [Escovopsis weberi]